MLTSTAAPSVAAWLSLHWARTSHHCRARIWFELKDLHTRVRLHAAPWIARQLWQPLRPLVAPKDS